jgi:hypothetical protein
MAIRKVEIECGLFQVLMTEQDLDSAQIGSVLIQMRGEAVPPIPGPE